jgi:uncharacterized protein
MAFFSTLTLAKILKRIAKILFALFVVFNILIAIHAYRTSHFYEQGEYPFKKPQEWSTSEKISALLFGVKQSKRAIVDVPATSYETVQLKDDADYQLEGWYVPCDSAKGTVILCHGHASTKSAIVKEANYFHQLGYNTFSLDARSHGNSEGNLCTVGYKEFGNVQIAYTFVEAKGEKNIILWGASMGAAMILKAVGECHLNPKKVILQAPFATMHDAVRGFLNNMNLPTTPFSELLLFWGSVEQGYWGFNYKPVTYTKNITMPVLLQWGRNDRRVTQAETDAIFNTFASTNKKLVVYEESGHQSFCVKEKEKWEKEVKSFLDF